MNIKKIIQPWVVIVALFVSLAMFGVLLLLLRGVPHVAGPFQGEAALTVIPAPTATPIPVVETEEPTPVQSSDQKIEIGSHVKIVGTGGDGLRIRSDHTLNGDVDYLGLENEEFIVIAGPNFGDGYTWWHLESPADEARNGWAVSNYLQVVNSQE